MNNFGFILVLAGILMTCVISQNVEHKQYRQVRNLKKRSIISLGQMIGKMTGRSPVMFINYGLWCGLGGEGTPVDAIDQCCYNHDKCYDSAITGPCKKLKEHPVCVRYSWRQNATESVDCELSEDECIDTICGCDVQISMCFKENMDSYNPKHRGKKTVSTLYKVKPLDEN